MIKATDIPKYTIVSDGGCSSSGCMYGSFLVENTQYHHVERLTHDGEGTNNQAEYLTIINALEWMHRHVGPQVHVTVTTDSKVVVNQVYGRWEVRRGPLLQLRNRTRLLMEGFRVCRIEWQPRRRIVARLGH